MIHTLWANTRTIVVILRDKTMHHSCLFGPLLWQQILLYRSKTRLRLSPADKTRNSYPNCIPEKSLVYCHFFVHPKCQPDSNRSKDRHTKTASAGHMSHNYTSLVPIWHRKTYIWAGLSLRFNPFYKVTAPLIFTF